MRLVEFNVHVARFAHLSWLGEGVSIRPDTRAEARLSEWLLFDLGLQHEMDWEMSEPEKRLWLLDAPSLARLALELALAMHRDWVLQLIDGRRRRVLEASVPAGAVDFVVTEVPQGQCHYREPRVSFAHDSASELGAKLTAAGARTLMGLLGPGWRAVRGRAQLYFDRSQRLGDVEPCEGAERTRALALICEWLVARRFSEWGWCF